MSKPQEAKKELMRKFNCVETPGEHRSSTVTAEEKMRKMWQTWQEGVESVTDKGLLHRVSATKQETTRKAPTQCNGKTFGFHTCMLVHTLLSLNSNAHCQTLISNHENWKSHVNQLPPPQSRISRLELARQWNILPRPPNMYKGP